MYPNRDPLRNAGRAPARRQHGMTLIEVMVAIVLLSIGIVGLLGLLATVSRNNDDAQDRNRAALLANELVAAMWLNNSTDVTTGNLNTVWTAWLTTAGNPANGKGLNLVGTPTVTAPSNPSASLAANHQALITIVWKAPHKTTSATTNTDTAYNAQEATNTFTTEVFLP